MARESLAYALNARALAGKGEHAHKPQLSDLTIKSYKASNRRFAEYCRQELGIKTWNALKERGSVQTVNDYVQYLERNALSAHTIHTMIAPVCKALSVNMREIAHPKRVSAEIRRGRFEVSRSERESNLGRYKPSVELQRAIGCRVGDLRRLTGGSLRETENGLYVYLPSGKGGKDQLQRILPQHEAAVRSAIAHVPAGERVLSAEQVSKNINYHGIRADVAKEAYAYYAQLVKDPIAKAHLQEHLIQRYEQHLRQRAQTECQPFNVRALAKFRHDIYNSTPYKLRGENLRLAINKGLPIEYDRLALRAVSIEHLSHWDDHCTISNYLLA